ncbi:ABC transporter ATP-binding protein, partial [bacterium (Candidatus Torokbacteria) CG_4_10_14_0_2_um_filter_35_8]
MKNIIKVDNVSKHYNKGKSHTVALDNVSFNLSKEESISIIGPSGSGKTTLLHIIGGLDNPSSGKVYIDGKLINNMSDNKLSEFRNKKIGFVFQFFNLQDYLTAEENVGLPAKMAGREEKEAKQKAEELLELVGLKY